ncbi:MAG: hypothetical protein LBB22_02445 [Treponema sp.]|nr:hypothetical protein [Treponema sp.]
MKKTEPSDSRLTDSEKRNGNGVVFYYSREERLKKASPRVRALYEEVKKSRFGIFTSLVDTRAKAMVFIAIIAASIMMLLFL